MQLVMYFCSYESYEDREQQIGALRSIVWGADYRNLPFPVKLHKLLSWEPTSSDLWWTDDGKSFAVDRQGFKRHVMNVFFDEHKFHSFQTLLHKYGFHSVESINNTVVDIIVYHHQHFERGNFELCKQISRAPSRRSSAAMSQLQHKDTATNATRPPSEATQEESSIASIVTNATRPPSEATQEESSIASIDDDDELLALAQELCDIEPMKDADELLALAQELSDIEPMNDDGWDFALISDIES